MDAQITSPGLPSGLLRRFALSYRSGLLLVLLVAVLTHLPTSFGRFSADDYLIRATTVGDAALFGHGFAKADPAKPFWSSLLDAYHFYTPDAQTLAFYQGYGNLPWWSSDTAAMNPLRPVTAITHWLDFRFVPDSFEWQAFHTLVYLLLFAWSGFRLFWRISPQPSVAVLASLMLVVDFSHLLNFNWVAARNVFIAGTLGCAALDQFLQWRQQRGMRALGVAMLLFVASLLAAEASIALLGYLFAYLLLVERGGVRTTVLALLPFMAIVVVWRLAYNLGGFGADGIGLYVDPGRSLGDFLLSALQTLPVMLAAPITTADGVLMGMAPEVRIWMAVASLLLALGCVALTWRLLWQRTSVRFMLAGSVLAAVPGAALISAGPRSGLFIGIGFFWVLSIWLHWLMRRPQRQINRLVLGGVLCLHLFVPALAGFVYTSQLLPVTYTTDGQFESVARSFPAQGPSRSLVIVNSHAPNMAFYLPFEWQFEHGRLPDSMNLLAPGLVTVDLTRLSAREFELVAPAGLPLNHTQALLDLQGNHPLQDPAFSLQALQGLFASPETRMPAGFSRSSGDMRVTVLALVDGRPSRLRIEFAGRENPDTMVWQWYDWSNLEYRAMSAPAIGETRRFSGPLDTEVASAVKLCINCES